ncbi:GNAT family N-acetyltransferase [Primorskyibacter sp. S187A]|uniref:GNAT family N-acetyltransferase n=1 Tax=Primorskyibacter sp. S187A TaxID=3415130 RepID=UPI003C79FF17
MMRCTQPTLGPALDQVATMGASIPVLRGPRVTLRAPKLRDFPAYQEIICSEHGQFLGPENASPSEAWYGFAAMTGGWLLHGHGGWAVELSAGEAAGETVGFVLIGLEPGDLEPELGYLFRAAFEGQGLAFEAASLALSHASAALQFPSLVSYIDPENSRSVALAKALGAAPDGTVSGSVVYRHLMDGDGAPEAYA